MMDRAIIHLNVADFAVAVERAVDTRLRHRPLIIAAEAAARAAVYDMSEEAYQEGVRKGMPLQHALRRCRKARVLPPRLDRYERAMTVFFKHALPYSPRIEVTDCKGHLFLDATGTSRLFGPAPDVARRIRRAVEGDMGLAPIWTVAANKLVAKAASRVVKPTGDYVVPPGQETAFLTPLPLHLLPGVEVEDLKRFYTLNLTRIGQAAALTPAQLSVLFGPQGVHLHQLLLGRDTSPVRAADAPLPAIRLDHDFGDDTVRPQVVKAALYRLVETAGAELRRRQLAARRLGVVLDYSDGRRTIRQAAAKPATANDFRLFAAAELALARAWQRRIRIRHLRLICDRLIHPPAQLELFADPRAETPRQRQLMATLDRIRGRFGEGAICVGRTLWEGMNIERPTSP